MNTYIDISEAIDEPILVDLLGEIDTVARSQGIEFFVVGAMARNLVMRCGFQIDPGRATRDVDIGVRLASWQDFEQLRDALFSSGIFAAHRQSQRLVFKDVLPVDVLPFGLISNQDTRIQWPSDEGVEMNMLGFEQAYDNSVVLLLRSEPKLEVRVASPVGLVMMKLIAWRDRKPGATKDAVDIGIVIRNYLDLGNRERLYNDHADLLEDPDFDYVLAGACLLGRDLATISNEDMREILADIMREIIEGDGDQLFVYRSAESGASIDKAASYLRAIYQELST